MRIALIGYGKMGGAVERIALDRGHQVVQVIDKDNEGALALLKPDDLDVVVEFTSPDAAVDIIRQIVPSGIPIVVGSTGWYDRLPEVAEFVAQHDGSLLYAHNFSVGVNIMLKVNRELAALMNHYPQYDVYLEERHHRHKRDTPSGTATRLANEVLAQVERKSRWVLSDELRSRPPDEDELTIGAVRAGEIVGMHRVTFVSDVDKIELSHEAFNRDGFALGAVVAAEWLCERKGFYEFSEIF